MHKCVLTFDNSLKLDADGVAAIKAKFLADLADPEQAVVCLPPGVTVCCVEAPAAKAKEVKHGHGGK